MTTVSSSNGGFNSSDPLQQELLNALAWGEVGTGANSMWSSGTAVGTGGNTAPDLTGLPVDQYGHVTKGSAPGSSSAEGPFQFIQSTWDTLAAKYNLNFANPSDQEAAAWYNASQTYATATGGQSLETALQNGQFTQIQQALAGQWPSVTGNGANPQGLAAALADPGHIPVDLFNGTNNPTSGAGSSSSASSSGTSSSSIISYIQRFGLIALGSMIIFIAIWKLLGDNNVVPGPAKTFKAAGAAL